MHFFAQNTAFQSCLHSSGVICSNNVNKLWQLLPYNFIEKHDLFNAYVNWKHMETLNVNKTNSPKRFFLGFWICCSTRKDLWHDTNFPFIPVADPGGFQGFHWNPLWNSYTLIEQSDRDSLIEQSDWDAPITVVLLEIIQ